MHNEIFHAPLVKPKRILDVGCGTGRITVQLANRFPDAEVIGVDLSPVPPVHPKSDNVEYIQDDFRELVRSGDARLQDGTFDYVFSRLLVLGMTDWPGYLRDVVSLLCDGGWVEIHEFEMIATQDINEHIISDDWPAMKALYQLTTRKGLDPKIGSNCNQLMQDCQLRDIREKTYRMPLVEDPTTPETTVCNNLEATME